MTSEQRREARYRRRQTRRQAKRKARSDALGPIEEVFSYRAMFFYGRKCCNGVRWKASTQRFEMHLFSGTAKRRRKILNGTWKPGKTAHFTLKERGKVRPIDAPHIEDRQVYKVLTKKVLVPLYVPSMIYDNKASQKGGGLHFHYRRLAKHLRDHYRKHGLEGALFLMDFHHFFPDAPHALLYERHRGMILNPDLRQLADLVVAAVPGGVGMPLGVEPSQQEMVALPSSIDNWMLCQAKAEYGAHFMDDYLLVFPTIEEAKRMGHEIVRRFESMGIRVNKKKCKVTPLTKPFRFCKAKFTLMESGKIRVNGSRDGVKRARRKLKLFYREFKEEKRDFKSIEQYMECQSAYYRSFDDHGRLLRLRRLYHAIFFGGATECSKSSKAGLNSA